MRYSLRLFLLFGFLLSLTSVSYAQTGDGITIRPANIQEQLNPGTEKTFSYTIRNDSDTPQTYYLGKKDIVGVTGGTAPKYADKNVEPTTLDLSTWITLDKESVDIGPHNEVEMHFSVKVPQDASPGNHFAAVSVSMEPPRLRQNGAAIGYEVANIVNIRVAGDVNEKADIRQFSTSNFIYGSLAIDFRLRIENSGNTLIHPTGPVEITNMFGKKVDGGLIFNETGAGVFPGSTREFLFSWKSDATGFGRYEAVISPVFGEEGANQTISSTVTFWVLPMNIIAPALGVLVVLLFVAYISVRLYVRRKLSFYQSMSSRKLVRNTAQPGSPLLLIFSVMITVTAVFFVVLVFLFS